MDADAFLESKRKIQLMSLDQTNARTRRQARGKGEKSWRQKRPSEKRKDAASAEAMPKGALKGVDFEVLPPDGKVDAGAPQGRGAATQVEIGRVSPQVASPRFDERGRVMVSIEDLRDDTISVVRNSHKTAEQIRADGGPHPQTLAKWLEGDTKRPQLNTIRAALLACDHDFQVVRRRPR